MTNIYFFQYNMIEYQAHMLFEMHYDELLLSLSCCPFLVHDSEIYTQ